MNVKNHPWRRAGVIFSGLFSLMMLSGATAHAAAAPLKVTSQPRAVTALVGGSAAFEVRATSTNTLTYQWRRAGTNVVATDRVLGATASRLQIASLTAADAGSYTVVIASSSGSITSSPALLTVRPDAVKPTVAMTIPKVTQTVSNQTINLQGTAKDNIALASVFYRVNTNAWIAAQGKSNWTGQVTLNPGLNTIQAYSMDINSNSSAIVNAKVTYVPVDVLSVSIGGGTGAISGSVSTKASTSVSYAIGKAVTLTATAAKGQTFAGWSGWTNSSSATIKFNMPSSPVDLVAQFNTPLPAGGTTYEGLIIVAANPANPSITSFTNMGFASATLSGQSFSAKFTFMDQVITTSGKVNSVPLQPMVTAHVTVTLHGKSVDAYINFYKSNPYFMTGALSDGNVPIATIEGTRVQNSNLGLYNAAVESDNSVQPLGYGFASLSCASSSATLNLTLPDENAKVTALSVNRLEQGMVPFFSPLYGNRGFVTGFLEVTNQQITSSSILWYKAPGAGTNYYPEGFFQSLTIEGGAYAPFAALTDWGTGTLMTDLDATGSVDFTKGLTSVGSYTVTANYGQSSDLWTITKATGLVTFYRDGAVYGNGIVVPKTASNPGIYGFSADIENGAGVVHSLSAGPQ